MEAPKSSARAVRFQETVPVQDMSQQTQAHSPCAGDDQRDLPREGPRSLSGLRFKLLGSQRGSLSFGLKKARAVRFDAGGGPNGEDHSADGTSGQSEDLSQQRARVLGSSRGSISLGRRKVKGVRFDGAAAGEDQTSSQGMGQQRATVLGSSRGSISFGLQKVKMVSFGQGESNESEAAEDGSIPEKRRQVLGSRRGSVFLGGRNFKAVRFDEPTQGDGQDASNEGGIEQSTSERKSISETRTKLLGSRRGSITLGLKKVKMVSFHDGDADVSSKEDDITTKGADWRGVRTSISGLRSTILGSRRGSISIPSKNPKGVQFLDDPVEPATGNDKGSSSATEGTMSGRRRSLSVLRSIVLGSRRGSVSIQRQHIPQHLLEQEGDPTNPQIATTASSTRKSTGFMNGAFRSTQGNSANAVEGEGEAAHMGNEQKEITHLKNRRRMSLGFLQSEAAAARESAGGEGVRRGRREGESKRRSSITLQSGLTFGLYGREKGGLEAPAHQVFPDIAT